MLLHGTVQKAQKTASGQNVVVRTDCDWREGQASLSVVLMLHWMSAEGRDRQEQNLLGGPSWKMYRCIWMSFQRHKLPPVFSSVWFGVSLL